MGLFVLPLIVGAAMIFTVAGVLLDAADRRIATYAGLIAGFAGGMVVGGNPVISLVLALVLAGCLRGYAVWVDEVADGNVVAFALGSCALAVAAPVFLLALPLEIAAAQREREAATRRRAERLWRDEFTASGATDPLTFTASNPEAMVPRAVREQLARRESGEHLPDVYESARRASAEARERSRARRDYLDRKRYVRKSPRDR